MKIKNLNENADRFQLLSSIFYKFPDLSEEDEDYLNSLTTDQLVSEIKNRGWEKDIFEESLNSDKPLTEYWDKIEDTPYYKVASKSVMDSDGFWTEYTMYYNEDEDNYFFIFGDSDIYEPDPAYADWECETNEEATEWYNNYNGFEDEDGDEENWMDEDEENESLERRSLDEDLFDDIEIPDAIPDPGIEIEAEPNKETPEAGPEFGVATLLNDLISTTWSLNSSYNDLIVNAEENELPEIAQVARDIAAEVTTQIGKLQAALSTISPNVENVSVGEEEVFQDLDTPVNEMNMEDNNEDSEDK